MRERDVVLVTGAASGIGRALVGALARRGAVVVACDVNADGLEQASAHDGWPADVARRVLDVRSAAAWRAVVDEALAAHGRVDVLCNVAGVLRPGWVHELEDADADLHLDVNAKGVMHGTRAVAPSMLARRRGHVVNVASLAGVTPGPGLAAYVASKFAVRGFSLSSDLELRPKGVAVTLVCPDAVRTPMLDLQLGRAESELTFSGARPLEVDEVVDAVLDALARRPVEVLLPGWRGALAKSASAFPAIVPKLLPLLRWHGRRVQAKERGAR